MYGDNAQPLSPSDASSVSIREQEQQLTASSTLIDDPVVNTASDQPGVTPQSPASETAVPEVTPANNFFGGNPDTYVNPFAKVI